MPDYSLTYDQKDLMIIPHSGMFNFTPPRCANGGWIDNIDDSQRIGGA